MLNGFRRRLAGAISPDKDVNKYYEAFLKFLGGQYTQYDNDQKTYIEQGYLYNPDLYSIVSQQQKKAASINWKVTVGEKEKDFPLDKPNPLQTWSEVKSLQKMFLKTTGNIFLYTPSPLDGMNAGVPQALYVLPSHLMKIIIRDDLDVKTYDESPIKSYMLIEGQVYTEFEASNIIHIKYPNPDFDFNGSHLYGLSPLRPLLRTIQSSNEAISQNLKTMQNSGVFGFIHGKGITLSDTQAASIRSRLDEADLSTSRYSNIMGSSGELGFTQIGLDTDKLKPFDFLKFDQKQLCNALGWSDKLLNNDEGGKYDNVSQFRRQVITDDIIPDNKIIDQAYQEKFVRRFKGYEEAILESTYDHLPEMQEDLNELMERVEKAVNIGLISRSQGLKVIGWEEFDDPSLEVRTVNQDVIPLEEAIDEDFRLNAAQNLQE